MRMHCIYMYVYIIISITVPWFVQHHRMGSSTKAAIIRIGLLEMWHFIDSYYHGTFKETLMESCGLADLIATSFGGRNRRLAEAMVLTGKVCIICTLLVN